MNSVHYMQVDANCKKKLKDKQLKESMLLKRKYLRKKKITVSQQYLRICLSAQSKQDKVLIVAFLIYPNQLVRKRKNAFLFLPLTP